MNVLESSSMSRTAAFTDGRSIMPCNSVHVATPPPPPPLLPPPSRTSAIDSKPSRSSPGHSGAVDTTAHAGEPTVKTCEDTTSVAAATTPTATHKYQPTKWDIWMLGITIGMGGQYYNWNAGLHAGLYSFLLDFFVIGFAYIALCCCTSEITGALPFAGGAYGLSRCTLGLYPGYLIGCSEACEYIAYVATSVMSLAKMIVEAVPVLRGFEPLLWLLIYAHANYVQYRGHAFFWRWNWWLGATAFLIVMAYCFGSLPHVNFTKNADLDPTLRFVGGVAGFVRALPLTCWFFVGVEALSMATDDVQDPTLAIPFAQIGCILTLLSVGIMVFFVTVSLEPPGLDQVAKLLAPLDFGFQTMFDIPLPTATLFSLPAMYATSFGFMWGYGKLIAAMATSKLLPPVLATTSEAYGTPHFAVLFGSVLGYLLALVVHFVPSIEPYLFNVCIASALFGYAAQCVGYIALKRLYPTIRSSTFHSPFGICGAIYSLSVWLLALLSVAGFQSEAGIEITGFLLLLAVLSLFYVAYSRSRQTFSTQETRVYLEAHIMRFKQHAAHRHRKGSKFTNLCAARPSMATTPTKRGMHTTSAKHSMAVHAESCDIGAVPSAGRLTAPSPVATIEWHPMGTTAAPAAAVKPSPSAMPISRPLASSSPFHRQFSSRPHPLNDVVAPQMEAARHREAAALR